MKSVTLVNLVPPLKVDTTVPLGPLYIASVLEGAGCSVDFKDYQLTSYENPLHHKNIIDFLSHAEDVLAIGCFFNVLPFLLPSLQKLKQENPEMILILGGPGPSSVAEPLMKAFPFVDVIVKGEGESTITEVVKGVPYHKIKGIVYQSRGSVVTTAKRERIHHLDALPFPAYDMVDLSQYDQAGVITARGCPYHCIFCEVASLWGYHTEQRSVSHVIDEIQMLYNHGVTSLHINDDTFVLNRKWVETFCDTLKNEIDMSWRCQGRINLMDEDLITKMANAQCTGIQYGIESGSEQVLKRVGKQISIPQAKEVITMSVDSIEHIMSTFMWGFPFETMDDFFQTIYVMGVLSDIGSLVKLLFLSPAPLSPLYKEYCNHLQFDEKFVPNVLWGIYKDKFLPEEKNEIIKMILEHPHVFSALYYIHTPEIEKKYQILSQAGMIHPI